MLITVQESNPPTTRARIGHFEAEAGLNLPSGYRQFLLRWNGGRPVPAAFPIAGFPNNPLGVIQVFFGLDVPISTEDLREVWRDLRGLIPNGIILIACTGCDDFLCIDTRAGGEPVKFWDRKPFWGTDEWREEDLYPVADSFSSLLTSLRDL